MKYAFYLVLSLTIIFTSCSTTKDKKFSDQVSIELVETFDLKDDKFEKFKILEVSKEVVVTVEDKKQTKVKKTPKKSKKKVSKKVSNKSKKFKKVEATSDEPVVTSNKESSDEYPDDYPEKFKNYNLKYKYVWDSVEPFFFENERFLLKASYLGITVGHAKLETLPMVNVAGKKAFHFKASLKSASFYSYIYEVEDWVESYVDATTFLPIKYTLVQRESGQDVDDLQLFDSEAFKTYFWYKRLKKGKIKKVEKNEFIPKYFQDSFAALYFVRGLDMKIGSRYEFPIITRAKLWLMKMHVEKIEEIKIMGKWIKAYRITAETRFPGILSKKGDIIFWFSTDKYRKILKFKANIKIGAVEGELVEYTKGDKRITKTDVIPGQY
ncbi:hypothetical protein A9Q84_04150 [Halobacteriovorax marinus]|uniref:DUF3108 domain-containing protein n=1 Tax=Halobacteriovorax marinus TaxID=97084 RepID=A0A1Y5FH17_9BACT|nr:hypothetical protein A9Q84_04150 [Halobacteriovorax marinus]